LFFPFVSMFFHLPFFWLIIQKCRLLPDFCSNSCYAKQTLEHSKTYFHFLFQEYPRVQFE
jgi:hypothetical protein